MEPVQLVSTLLGRRTRGDTTMTFTMTFKQLLHKVFAPKVSRSSRRGKSRQPSRQQRSPSIGRFLEVLEDRIVPSATPGAPDSFLLTPVSDGTPIAMHIHPRLSIRVNGQDQVIPAGIGVGASGD